MKWNRATQGSSGLWFKSGLDGEGRRHLLVADSRNGVESGSHDHYWESNNGYGVQLRDRSGSASVGDRKGHLYARDTSFPAATNLYLSALFDRYA